MFVLTLLYGPSIVYYWIVLYTFQAITEGLLGFFLGNPYGGGQQEGMGTEFYYQYFIKMVYIVPVEFYLSSVF